MEEYLYKRLSEEALDEIWQPDPDTKAIKRENMLGKKGQDLFEGAKAYIGTINTQIFPQDNGSDIIKFAWQNIIANNFRKPTSDTEFTLAAIRHISSEYGPEGLAEIFNSPRSGGSLPVIHLIATSEHDKDDNSDNVVLSELYRLSERKTNIKYFEVFSVDSNILTPERKEELTRLAEEFEEQNPECIGEPSGAGSSSDF